MFISRAVKLYVSVAYLVLLIRNALIVAAYAVIQAYNQSSGHPNWNMLGILFLLAFGESIFEHFNSTKLLALLQLIWQALQQLNPSSLQQMLILLQNIQPKDGTTLHPAVRPGESTPPYMQR